MTQEQDREFEAYLRGESPLSHTYAGMRGEEPPARLDHAVLAEAHRAVRAQPGRSAWRRWSLPLSVAATLVVAVLVGLEQSYLPRTRGDFAPAPAAGPASAPAAAAGPEARDKQAVRAKQYEGAELDKFEAPQGVPAAAPAGMPAPGAQVSARKAQAEPPRAMETLNPAPAEPLPVQQETKPAAPAQPSAAAEHNQAGRLAKPEAAPVARETLRMNAAPAAEAPPPAATEAAPPMERAPAAAAPAMEMAPAAPAAAILGDAPASSGGGASGVGGASAPLAPGPWLARIEKLKREGKREAAKKDLAAFMKRYPDYPIPKGLRDLRRE